MHKGLVTAAVAVALSAFVVPPLARGAKKEAEPSIGSAAPNFTLKNQDGKDVKLSDFKGKVVVLQWLDPACPFVQRHYEKNTFQDLHTKWKAKDVVHLAIHSGAGVEQNKRFHERQKLDFDVLADKEGAVAKLYGAKTTPHMFVIDKDGKLAYRGAIDNDPDGDRKGDKVNYVDKALEELTNARPVSEPETKSYGCDVKVKQ
jgi:peroxiredoxin